ncbi:MAG: YbaK/EbsC family protein [Mycobacteriales bacterium]
MLHPNAERIAGLLDGLGVAGQVRQLSDSTRTAADAAAALGCDVGAIASSLLFLGDGEPLLVMTSGAHRVDTAQVAALLDLRTVERAPVELVREVTGQAIGGVSPVGHPRPLPTLVDVWLARHDTVWAAAGHPHAVFPTTYDELLRITAGTSAEVA